MAGENDVNASLGGAPTVRGGDTAAPPPGIYAPGIQAAALQDQIQMDVTPSMLGSFGSNPLANVAAAFTAATKGVPPAGGGAVPSRSTGVPPPEYGPVPIPPPGDTSNNSMINPVRIPPAEAAAAAAAAARPIAPPPWGGGWDALPRPPAVYGPPSPTPYIPAPPTLDAPPLVTAPPEGVGVAVRGGGRPGGDLMGALPQYGPPNPATNFTLGQQDLLRIRAAGPVAVQDFIQGRITAPPPWAPGPGWQGLPPAVPPTTPGTGPPNVPSGPGIPFLPVLIGGMAGRIGASITTGEPLANLPHDPPISDLITGQPGYGSGNPAFQLLATPAWGPGSGSPGVTGYFTGQQPAMGSMLGAPYTGGPAAGSSGAPTSGGGWPLGVAGVVADVTVGGVAGIIAGQLAGGNAPF